MPITDYNLFSSAGFPGESVTQSHVVEDLGAYNESVNTEALAIPFGAVVVRSGTTGGVKLPHAASQVPVGIAVANSRIKRNEDGTSPGYVRYAPVSYRRLGTIYAIAEVAMAKTDTVYFRHAAAPSPGAYDGLGRIRNDVDTQSATAYATALGGGCTVMRACAAGEVVAINMSLGAIY